MVTTPQTTPSPHSERRVLVVEDDLDIASLISMHLKDNGFEVHVEPRGDHALSAIETGAEGGKAFDLLVIWN